MLTEVETKTLFDLVIKLLTEAHHARRKSYREQKSWSLFWKCGHREVDVYFCDAQGYRLAMGEIKTTLNVIIDHSLTGFFETPRISGCFSTLLEELNFCANIWHKGYIE